ncbi:MAG: hypothetical protein ACE361_05725 [Aureliella sp.]
MKRVLATAMTLLLCAQVATAQQRQRFGGDQGSQQRSRGAGGTDSRPGTPGSSALERAGLRLGQALPNVTVFDENRGKFRVADIRKKHTVIVFGCLT